MKTNPFILALAGLSMTTTAHAADSPPANDWYISGAVGITSTRDADFNQGATSGDFELDNSISFAGAVGRNVGDNLRAELELSYRSADLDTLNITGVGSAAVSGDLDTTAAMLNGYYDVSTGTAVMPYLSAGIGLARHDGTLSGGGITVSDDDTVFAYQLGAGASVAVADDTALFGGYRYLGSSDANFDGLKAEYGAHEFRVGLRHSF